MLEAGSLNLLNAGQATRKGNDKEMRPAATMSVIMTEGIGYCNEGCDGVRTWLVAVQGRWAADGRPLRGTKILPTIAGTKGIGSRRNKRLQTCLLLS